MSRVIFIFFIFYSPSILFSHMNAAEEKSFFDDYTSVRDRITDNYHHLLKTIDNTLCSDEELNNAKLEKIIYKNKLEIITSLKQKEGEALKAHTYIHANIILPKTNKRFEFTITKQTDSPIINKNLDREYDNTLENEQIHFGFKYNLVKNDYFNFYSKIGSRINKPKDAYGKVGIVKYLNFQSFMLFFNAQLYQYILDEKLIASTSLNIIKPLNSQFIFEKDIRLTWEKKKKTTTLEHIAKLYHIIDKKNSLLYWLSYEALDDGECYFCPKEYRAHILYRHMLSKWAYIELIPQLVRKKKNDFHTQEVILLNVGFIFSR